MSVEPIITNDRDRRSWEWICKQVGGAEIAKMAIDQLPGNRKPYISNLAKLLKLTIPPEVIKPPLTRAQQLEHIKRIRSEHGL